MACAEREFDCCAAKADAHTQAKIIEIFKSLLDPDVQYSGRCQITNVTYKLSLNFVLSAENTSVVADSLTGSFFFLLGQVVLFHDTFISTLRYFRHTSSYLMR